MGFFLFVLPCSKRFSLAGGLGKSGVINSFEDIKIDLAHPKNVMGWYVLRLVLADFGSVFYRRLNLYTAYFGVYLILQVVFIILQAVIPSLAVNDVPLILILYDLAVFMALLMLIVSCSLLFPLSPLRSF